MRLRELVTNRFGCIYAVEAGQVEVHQHNIGLMPANSLERGITIVRLCNNLYVITTLEQGPKAFPNDLMVLDKYDAYALRHRAQR